VQEIAPKFHSKHNKVYLVYTVPTTPSKIALSTLDPSSIKFKFRPGKVLSWFLGKRSGPDFGNPENLTNEERLSRLLHNPKTTKIPGDGHIYEHFVIMGLVPHSSDPEPQVLYQYPENVPISIPKIAGFCFPHGITPTKVPRKDFTEDQLLKILFISNHEEHPENHFVFLLTTEDEQVVYGVCIVKDEIINGATIEKWDTRKEYPSYAQLVNSSSEGSNLVFSPRCYCLISRYPFFRLHFAVLNDILALEYTGDTTVDKASSSSSKSNSSSSPNSSFLSPSSVRSPVKSNSQIISRSNSYNQNDLGAMVEENFEKEGDFNGNIARWVLAKYHKLKVGNAAGTTVFRSVLDLPPITFKRPCLDEPDIEMLCEYALPLIFQQLSKDNLFAVLSCILCERKVLIYAPNLRILSSVVLGWAALIRPFVYQSVLIPILPESLFTMISAPVPFLVGVTTLPPKSEIPNDVVVVDVERDRVLNLGPGGAPQIPRFKELEIKIKPLYKELMRELPLDPRTPMYAFASDVVFHLVEEICTTMKAHLLSLFTDFHKHCIKDLTDNNKPITVFLKESFLDQTPKVDRPFFQAFLQSQMFFAFSDARLRKADEKNEKAQTT
jgi:hypothetical protein